MIRNAWRAVARFLTSTYLAIGLLVFIGVWSMVATAVAQGLPSVTAVVAWAAAHPLVEPLVRALGLHQAFTAPLFILSVVLLGLSTALCAWRRTKVAISRARALRTAATADERSLIERHDLEIECDPDLSPSQVLSIASDTLERLGIKTRRRENLLTAVSSPWSVWGSAVFHWALLATVLVILVGQLQRSDGLMGLAVGQTKADAPASYGVLTAGPLHDWTSVHRSIRLDALEPDFKTRGIDVGAVPTVSVLDGAGNVIVAQRVYPNNMLHAGSLSINAPGVGLSVALSLVDPSGAQIARAVQLVDFSQTAPEGTVPAEPLALTDKAGKATMIVRVTVPLDREGGHFGEWIPKQPAARVVVTATDGTPIVNRVVTKGQDVALPGGGAVRLDNVGWYSRLSLVDDWTTPLLYAVLGIGLVGLTMTTVARQQLVLATATDGPDGPKLAVRIRLWRSAPARRTEIGNELERALQGADTEGDS